MSHKQSTPFGWIGQFSAFAAGDKSPYQYLTMQLAATGAEANSTSRINRTSSSSEPLAFQEQHCIKLNGSLRRMMVGYLQPQDWIRVVGHVSIDSQTGETQWKAREIVKISVQQAMLHASQPAKKTIQHYSIQHCSDNQPSIDRDEHQPKIRPTRVLMCQKSGCRQRGAQAVEAAIAHVIAAKKQAGRITIQPTGCMKQCKSGPHLILIPPDQPKAQSATLKYTHVTPQLVPQILEKIL